jgi:hypothetical protein
MARGLGYASDGLGCCCGGDWRHEGQYSSFPRALPRQREQERSEAVPYIDVACAHSQATLHCLFSLTCRQEISPPTQRAS